MTDKEYRMKLLFASIPGFKELIEEAYLKEGHNGIKKLLAKFDKWSIEDLEGLQDELSDLFD